MKKLRVLTKVTFSLLICFMLLAGCNSSASTDKVPVSIDISDSEYEPMNEYIERLRVFL